MKDIGRSSKAQAYEKLEAKKQYPVIQLPLDKFPKLGNIRTEAMLLVKVRTRGVTANESGDFIDLEVLKAEITRDKTVNQSLESLTGGWK